MQMIADRLIELEVVETISDETVRLTLHRNELKETWCIAEEQNAEFVAAMEDVLDVYHRPVDRKQQKQHI
jgi:hypothetical protein